MFIAVAHQIISSESHEDHNLSMCIYVTDETEYGVLFRSSFEYGLETRGTQSLLSEARRTEGGGNRK